MKGEYRGGECISRNHELASKQTYQRKVASINQHAHERVERSKRVKAQGEARRESKLRVRLEVNLES